MGEFKPDSVILKVMTLQLLQPAYLKSNAHNCDDISQQ